MKNNFSNILRGTVSFRPSSQIVFKNYLYLSTILFITTLLFDVPLFWVKNKDFASCEISATLFNFSNCYNFPNSYIIFLALYILSIGFFFLKSVDNFFVRLSIMYSFNSLCNINPTLLDGGNNLIQILLIYLVFMPKGHTNNQRIIGNYAFMLSMFQIVVLYFVAGISKSQVLMWQNGTAIYYVLSNPEYSIPFIYKDLMPIIPDAILVTITYLTLLFQILFPILVFIPNFNKLVLFLGFLFHLNIGITMGLFNFAVFMIASHSAFYQEDFSIRVLEFFSILKLTRFKEKFDILKTN